MKSTARPILTALRGVATKVEHATKQSEVKGASSKGKQAAIQSEPKITTLPNGTVVASVERNSPVSHVALVFNAGSRVETPGNLGITHCLRNAANLTSQNISGFAFTRTTQQLGASFSCTSTRDCMFYQLDSIRDNVDELFPHLASVALAPAFHHWEITDNVKNCEFDLRLLAVQPETQLVEALHQAAYRSGLGNSLYMPEIMVGKHSGGMLHDFVKNHFTSDNMAVVGLGMDHDHLLELVKKNVTAGRGKPEIAPSKYHGGEIRMSVDAPLVHAAVVTEAANLGNKELFTMEVLQHLMGVGPTIKYVTCAASSKVGQAAAKVSSNPCAASAISMSYAESGLFGFHVVAHRNDVRNVLKAVAGQFAQATKSGFSDAELKCAKVQLKSAIHMTAESSFNLLEDAVSQAMFGGSLLQSADINAAIDKITVAEVNSLAKKVFNGKPSMAVVGDAAYAPYLDELF